MIIAVGSTNIVKIGAVKSAFQKIFSSEKEIRSIGMLVNSGVRRQPFGDSECIGGARNRACAALQLQPDAEFAVGLESGICSADDVWFDRGWVVVKKRGGEESIGSTASLIIPNGIVRELQANADDGLGSLLDRRLGRKDIKRAEGYTGVATHKNLTRLSLYIDAVILACAPFTNAGFFVEN